MCAKFDDSSLNSFKDMTGAPNISSGSRDPDHAPFKGHLSSACWDLALPICVQNVTTMASAIPKYGWCQPKFKWFT